MIFHTFIVGRIVGGHCCSRATEHSVAKGLMVDGGAKDCGELLQESSNNLAVKARECIGIGKLQKENILRTNNVIRRSPNNAPLEVRVAGVKGW